MRDYMMSRKFFTLFLNCTVLKMSYRLTTHQEAYALRTVLVVGED